MGTGMMEEATANESAGIIPRAVEYLSRHLQLGLDRTDGSSTELYVSFLEIYNEEIIDLLNPTGQQDCKQRKGILAIREDAKGEIFVTGIKEERAKGTEDVLTCLRNGSLCRTTKSTQMNLVSSRSHAIFTVTLRQRRRPEDSLEWCNYISKLHFVDLAGSERLKRTQAAGDRAKESISINSGLLALGNVISALGDESRKASHIPYRDSKLTRLLQDSLGGNSRTLMIACVSPSSDNLQETLNTLKYAHRARNIRNRIQVGQDSAGDAAFEVVQLKKQVAALKQQLNQLRSNRPESVPTQSKVNNQNNQSRGMEDLQRRLDQVIREKQIVEQERDMLRAAVANDATKSPKTKEYLRTISALRSQLVQLQQQQPSTTKSNNVTGQVRRKLTGKLTSNAMSSPSRQAYEPAEPGTPKWFQAVDDLLDRAKTDIEKTYDTLDAEMETCDDRAIEDNGERLDAIRTDLSLRAELIQQIETSKQEYLCMRARFEERLALLQGNLKSIQSERDQALTQLTNNGPTSGDRVGLNRLTRQKYEERIKKLGKELNDLKEKLRTSLATSNKSSSASDTLIRNLRSTIGNLKIENGRLTGQVTEELGRLREAAASHEQSLRDLRQSERRAQEASRKWKKAHDFQRTLAQKRIEQCLQGRAKIRQLVQLLRKHRVNLGSPSTGIDWGSPGWRALQADHPSPLIPSRLLQLQQGVQAIEPPASPTTRHFGKSLLGKGSVSAEDLVVVGDDDDPCLDSTDDLAEATSQLAIDPDDQLVKPSISIAGLTIDKRIEEQASVLPKSILRASPLLPKRRDFLARLADLSSSSANVNAASSSNPTDSPTSRRLQKKPTL